MQILSSKFFIRLTVSLRQNPRKLNFKFLKLSLSWLCIERVNNKESLICKRSNDVEDQIFRVSKDRHFEDFVSLTIILFYFIYFLFRSTYCKNKSTMFRCPKALRLEGKKTVQIWTSSNAKSRYIGESS